MDLPTPQYVLVDGSSYLFRAFHGLPPLTNTAGLETGAIYGVVNMLRSLKRDYSSSQIAVIFDAKGKTFREEFYPEYKANREKMPDALAEQIAPLHAIIKALGLPIIVESGVEADDVIGTLARQATQHNIPCLISTGDKDLAQLVSPSVSLINTMTGQFLDEIGVKEKFGVEPAMIIDFLALKGDSSDNIPGVPGVGDKSAIALLNGLGNLDAVYAQLDKVATLGFRGAKTMASKLEQYKDQAFLSYKLATVKTDVAMDIELQELHDLPEDLESLVYWFEQLEFKTWLRDLTNREGLSDSVNKASIKNGSDQAVPMSATSVSSSPSSTTNIDRTRYQLISSNEQLDDMVAELLQQEVIGFDTETTSLNYAEATLVGMSFATVDGRAWYVPCGHSCIAAEGSWQSSVEHLLEKTRPLLQGTQKKLVGHNLKYDANVLANYQQPLSGILCDTMLTSYVLNSVGQKHNMDALALALLGHQCISYEEVAGKGKDQLNFSDVPLSQAFVYAAEDADISVRLYRFFQTQLSDQSRIETVLNDIEIPLLSVLSKIESQGVLIDRNELEHQSKQLAQQINELQARIFELVGEEFNIGSPKQLQHILYDKLELPVVKKTPKGAPSTSEEVLQDLANQFEFPALVLEYRAATKLKNTYTEKLPQLISNKTGRVHTSYHQAITATGRLSSSDPNLQNIPIRTEQGRRIRKAFVAPPGKKIVAADYSQIELRIMAHLSQDEGLTDAFNTGLDIHKATAAEIFACALDEVTAEQRRSAKAINFGLIYGMSAFGLARNLNITRTDAQHYMDSYFSRYPGVLRYMENTRESARSNGYVETLVGRRLYLPEIKVSNGARRAAAERAAINAPMQGTAADIIKLAMIKVQESIEQASNSGVAMIMQVHDELVFEVPESLLNEFDTQLRTVMQSALDLDVPLVVDVGWGDNWDEAH